MAKKGMKRPERTKLHPNNEAAPVPEIQGKAKSSKEKANPIDGGKDVVSQKIDRSTDR